MKLLRQKTMEENLSPKKAKALVKDILPIDVTGDENERLIIDVLFYVITAKRTTMNALANALRGYSVEQIYAVISLFEGNGLDVVRKNSEVYITSSFEIKDELLFLANNNYTLPPMLVKPLPAAKRNNRGTGYLLGEADSVITNGKHYSHLPVNDYFLDVINEQAYKVDVELAGELWPEGREDFMVKTMVAVMNYVREDEFYLPHKYDHRGRAYSRGYMINTQSDCYGKSIVEFAESFDL